MAINWVDRVATHPGRVQLTPVQGQTNIYDMERADEPTVAGTPINAANLNAMQKNMGLDANMTVYVAVSGSDATGNGSSTAPYQTITKALSTIPKNLNGYQATINIASGTYAEVLTITGFSGGTLNFTGAEGDAVSVINIVVRNCDDVVFSNLNYNLVGADNVTYGVHLTNSQIRVLTSFNVSNASTTGVYALLGSTFYLMNLNVSNVGEGIGASNGARIIVGNISGSARERGMRAVGGGIVAYTNNSLSAPVMFATSGGGRIYSGSQTNIPNY